jgi:hypothetical protein
MTTDPRARRGILLLACAMLLGMVACGSDDEVTPPPVHVDSVRDVVETTGWFPSILPDSNAFAEARFDSTSLTDDPLSCTDYEGTQIIELAEITMLAADPGLQYPGAVLQWASLGEVAPDPVLAARPAGTLNLYTATGVEVEGTVDALDGDLVDAWRRDALVGAGATESGLWDLRAGVVYNLDHVAIIGRLDPAAMTAEASDRLAFRDTDPGRVLVRLQRVHHSVNASYSGHPDDAFADHVVGDDVADQMAPGNAPVWVSQVDHGQLLLVLVEADATDPEVTAAVLNSFTAAVENRAPDAGAPLVHDLPGVAMSVMAVGADSDAAEVACNAGLAELTEFLHTEPTSPADLPGIAMTLLAVRNGGPLWREASCSYAFTRCVVYEPVFDEVLWSFQAADAHTEAVEGDLSTDGVGRYLYNGGSREYLEHLVDYIPDLVGAGGSALPDDDGRRPFYLPDAVNGHPAVEVYQLTLPDGVIFSELEFDGSRLVGRDYTIFLVAGQPRNVRLRYTTPSGEQTISRLNDVDYFVHGRGEGQRHDLRIGYPNQAELRFEHFPYGVQFPYERDDEWHVFAFRFGQSVGMAVYRDGELLSEVPGYDLALLEFSGATLCARWRELGSPSLGVFWMVEMTAYAGAGSEVLIAEETARLRQKYDLD